MNHKQGSEGKGSGNRNFFERVKRCDIKKKISIKSIFIIITGVMILTGCSKTKVQEKLEYAETVEGITAADTIEAEPEHIQKEGNIQKGENIQKEENMQAGEETESIGGKSIENEGSEGEEMPEGGDLILDSNDWGLSFQESGMQPIGNATAEALEWYRAYYVGNDSEKIIYLTFDCGYENGNTEPILDALKKHDAKGTFFVVGHFLETASDLVKRMVEEGHAVGNHTYHHPDMSAISDIESFRKELSDVETLFLEITGEELSPYYRPPQGKCNVENMKMAKKLGYSTIFWSLAHVDWDQQNQPDRDKALEKLTERIHPGAVVLLHNTSQTNGEILDDLLTKWEEMGYSFQPLSGLVVQE